MITLRTIGYAVALGSTIMSAQAQTFTGHFTGAVTDGFAQYIDFRGGNYSVEEINLAGKSFVLDFQAIVKVDYYFEEQETYYSKYVYSFVNFKIDIPAPLNEQGTIFTNDVMSFYPNLVDFTGNAQAASYLGSGYSAPGANNTLSLMFNYAGASQSQGAVSGGGSVGATVYYFGQGQEFSYGMNFMITDGYVIATGVPEPAQWAMLIAGFGLAGGACRRQLRTTVAYA